MCTIKLEDSVCSSNSKPMWKIKIRIFSKHIVCVSTRSVISSREIYRIRMNGRLFAINRFRRAMKWFNDKSEIYFPMCTIAHFIIYLLLHCTCTWFGGCFGTRKTKTTPVACVSATWRFEKLCVGRVTSSQMTLSILLSFSNFGRMCVFCHIRYRRTTANGRWLLFQFSISYCKYLLCEPL